MKCKDHLGKSYDTEKDLCEAYGITVPAFIRRKKNGYSLKDALTKPTRPPVTEAKCTDHLGKVFPSQQAMCDTYGVSLTLYMKRLSRGYSVEEALTKSVKKRNETVYKDHLGNTYDTLQDLCYKYKITPYIYHNRMRLGWSLKRILTGKHYGHNHTDHLGNTYESLDDLCNTYGINKSTYYSRINRYHWSVEKALTTVSKRK